jgi:peptidoglycan/xylan/chitin deacetylase (PgdA/CDA1 family)
VERADDKAMKWNDQMLKRKLFPSALFNKADEYVYLTFDDGPHPVATPIVLQELKKHNIRATFFLLGQNAQKFPDLVRQIHSEGHQIANHSFTHANLFFKNKTFIRDEIVRTQGTIESIIGKHSHYFRPPYGYLNWAIMDVIRELGLTCVLWDVDSKDYRLKSVTDISTRVIPNTKNGSILLFHDNELTLERGQTYLPVIFAILRRRKFVFQTMPT